MIDPALVFTPLGKGKVIADLGDGRVVVRFQEGGVETFFKHEVFSPNVRKDSKRRELAVA